MRGLVSPALTAPIVWANLLFGAALLVYFKEVHAFAAGLGDEAVLLLTMTGGSGVFFALLTGVVFYGVPQAWLGFRGALRALFLGSLAGTIALTLSSSLASGLPLVTDPRDAAYSGGAIAASVVGAVCFGLCSASGFCLALVVGLGALVERAFGVSVAASTEGGEGTRVTRVTTVDRVSPSRSAKNGRLRLERISELAGHLFPRHIREGAWEPAIHERLEDTFALRKKYRRRMAARRWITFCFWLNFSLTFLQTLRVWFLDSIAMLVPKKWRLWS